LAKFQVLICFDAVYRCALKQKMGEIERRRAGVRMKFRQNCKPMIKKKKEKSFFFLLDSETETKKKLQENKIKYIYISLPKLVEK